MTAPTCRQCGSPCTLDKWPDDSLPERNDFLRFTQRVLCTKCSWTWWTAPKWPKRARRASGAL